MSTETIVTKKTGIGAAIGGLIGFICAGPMGAGIGALVGGGVAHASDQPNKGVMTARRKVIYERAMESVKSPDDLNALANAFAGEGLDTEAEMLRKRAALRALPPETKEKRRAYFRKGMASDNPDTIDQVAAAFQGEGALDAAKALSDHADAVRAAHLAGKSTKPMAGGSQEQFADKLAKAIMHFGGGSQQAKTAAANLVRARGKQSTDILVAEVIKVAAKALDIKGPPTATAAPPAAVDNGDPGTAVQDTTEPQPMAEPLPTTDGMATGSVEEDQAAIGAEDVGKGAPEPTVVGPPAENVEPPAAVEAASKADVGVVANEGDGGMANEGASVV